VVGWCALGGAPLDPGRGDAHLHAPVGVHARPVDVPAPVLPGIPRRARAQLHVRGGHGRLHGVRQQGGLRRRGGRRRHHRQVRVRVGMTREGRGGGDGVDGVGRRDVRQARVGRAPAQGRRLVHPGPRRAGPLLRLGPPTQRV